MHGLDCVDAVAAAASLLVLVGYVDGRIGILFVFVVITVSHILDKHLLSIGECAWEFVYGGNCVCSLYDDLCLVGLELVMYWVIGFDFLVGDARGLLTLYLPLPIKLGIGYGGAQMGVQSGCDVLGEWRGLNVGCGAVFPYCVMWSGVC